MREPIVDTGILTDATIEFALYGDYAVEGHDITFSGIFRAETIGQTVLIRGTSREYKFDKEVTFVPSSPETEHFMLKHVIIGEHFHWERKEKESFKGSLKIIINGQKVTAINLIPMEEYLVSVISSEMSPKSSIELLKAHAVISRSWVLAQIQRKKQIRKHSEAYVKEFRSDDELVKWYDREDHVLYDVCADDHCQRYQGITKIFTDVAVEAVYQTRGLVLTQDDKICDARFSKCCGGITESFSNVWEQLNPPYLRSVIDYKFEPDNYEIDFTKEENAAAWIEGNPPAYCNTTDKKILSQILLHYDLETSDFYRWKHTYSQEKMKSIIEQKTGMNFGSILDLIPIERGKSGRLIRLKIVGSEKTFIIGKELEIRRTLSKSHLYSAAITIRKRDIVDGVPQHFDIYGAGWGHGVGLCQIGAAVMAEKGYQFDEILTHYYTTARLKRIYE